MILPNPNLSDVVFGFIAVILPFIIILIKSLSPRLIQRLIRYLEEPDEKPKNGKRKNEWIIAHAKDKPDQVAVRFKNDGTFVRVQPEQQSAPPLQRPDGIPTLTGDEWYAAHLMELTQAQTNHMRETKLAMEEWAIEQKVMQEQYRKSLDDFNETMRTYQRDHHY